MRAPFSLRWRLALIFSCLTVLGVLLCGGFLYQQNRALVRQSEQVAQAQLLASQSFSIRDDVHALQLSATHQQKPSRDRLRTIERQVESLHAKSQALGVSPSDDPFARFSGALDRYQASLLFQAKTNRKERAAADTALGRAASDLVSFSQNQVVSATDALKERQRHSTRIAFLLLALFIFFVLIAGIKAISAVTAPLSSLANFLDHLDMDRLPTSLPHFGTEAAEVATVSASFERLLNRLEGFKSLNLRRLLLEKHRADLIAGAISEGIILLRGEEILYVNPVAERILGIPGGSPNNGQGSLHLKRDLSESSGARAILMALDQTMPIEFALEEKAEDKSLDGGESTLRKHYLIQAYPVTEDMVETWSTPLHESLERTLEQFQPTALVLAQDVTIVKESQEAKGHFLGTLSHEIKTPVTSLTMATRLLRRALPNIPDQTHRTLIETCAEDVDRLRVLLDDLLKVSSFDTLTQKLQPQNVDITKLVKNTVQSFHVPAKEREISLSWKVARTEDGKDAPTILAVDPPKVAWALSNILTNALRHTPRGGKVEITTEISAEGAKVSVADTGPGIDPKRQARIFEKFNPHYNLRVARTGSAGFGLAIAREIVLAHGGRIWVTSQTGMGAEFCFTLPFQRSAHKSETGPSVSNATTQPGMRVSLDEPAAHSTKSADVTPNLTKGATDGARTSSR